MRLITLKLTLLAGLATATSLPASTSYVRRERRDLHPDLQLVKKDRVPHDTMVPVNIVLTQRNLKQGHELLSEISDPTSSRFGQHYSREEVRDMFAPHQGVVNSVSDWLHSSGLDSERHSISSSQQIISFVATAAELEKLLQSEFNIYTRAGSANEHIGCDDYHVPSHVHPHIDFITPAIDTVAVVKRGTGDKATSVGYLRPIQRKLKGFPPHITNNGSGLNSESLSDCDVYVTPECIRALYNIPLNQESTQCADGNELGIFEMADYYDQEDNNMFFANFTKIPKDTKPRLISIDGGMAPIEGEPVGYESLLDMQLAYPIIYPQGVALYQVDDQYWSNAATGFGNTFLDALDESYCTYQGGDNSTMDPNYPDTHAHPPFGYNGTRMCGTYKPTNIITVSYGLGEFVWSRAYTARQCHEYMKLALAGITVVYASGDSGVASRQGCLDREPPFGPPFAPDFPATCPYVLSVGATMIEPGNSVTDPEVVANLPHEEEFASGGGFSNNWGRPQYQNDAVEYWYANHRPNYTEGTYNISGRGYPDVAAVGWNISTVTNGGALTNGGTSASAPIVASMLTRINEMRLAAGKSTVGFVNPTFYKHPEIFNDITIGNNPGCNTPGFQAVEKWDPASGLGTLDFKKLLDLYMRLP